VIGKRPTGLERTVSAAHHLAGAGRAGPALAPCLRAAGLAARMSAYPERLQMLRRAAALWDRVPEAPERTGTDLSAVLADATEPHI
jgi:hypothetical protein